MTAQDTIPADIMAVARDLARHAGWSQSQDTLSIAKAILAERQRDQWQPIETAPKDGTQFLAFELDCYFNCWWHDNGYGEQYWMDEADSEPNPTHWMPLPATPKGGEA